MEEMDFACVEAIDGQDAFSKCSGNMPDIVILDWNMPNMNGLEFLLKLRSMEHGQDPKVLFCTTENGMDYIHNGMAAGADEYIMKPFDKEIILTKLEQLGILNAYN